MNVFIILYRYFLGTLKIKISGDFAERFFNVLAADRIRFWNIEKKNDYFYVCILKKDILKLKHIRRRTNVQLNIVNKSGFPVILHKYKKRYGIIIGAVLFFALLSLASSRIWIVKVNGSTPELSQRVVNELSQLGVYKGIKKQNLDTDLLKQKLLLSQDNLSWSSLNIQGSVLEVNVVDFENSKAAENTACNLIAETDGIIVKISVNTGRSEVKVGQTVKKGQLLVSGIKTEKGVNSFIPSEGQIYASVPYNFSVNIPKSYIKKNYLSESKNRYAVEIMSLKIPLFIGDVKGSFDTEYSENVLTAFGNSIPISLHKQKINYYQEEIVIVNYSNALELAKNELSTVLEKEKAIDYEIISSNVEDNKESYCVEFSIRKTVDIAKKDFFKINSENW